MRGPCVTIGGTLLGALLVAIGCGSADDSALDPGPVSPGASTCGSSSDCSGSNRFCNPGTRTCAECLASSDCGAGATCDALSGQCKAPCDPNVACSGDLICAARGVCVRCASNADCASGDNPLCSPELDRCVECLSNRDCSTSSPVCSGGRCIECAANSQCRAGEPFCDLEDGDASMPHRYRLRASASCVSGRCAGPCGWTRLWGELPACDIASGRCVECLADMVSARAAGSDVATSRAACAWSASRTPSATRTRPAPPRAGATEMGARSQSG